MISLDPRPLNSLEKLNALSLVPVTNQAFEDLEVKNMTIFTFYCIPDVDIIAWEGFHRKHPKLESLGVGSKLSVSHLKIIQENIQKFKVLYVDVLMITEEQEQVAIESREVNFRGSVRFN